MLFVTVQVLAPERAAELARLYQSDYRERVDAAGLQDIGVDPTVISEDEEAAAAAAGEERE